MVGAAHRAICPFVGGLDAKVLSAIRLGAKLDLCTPQMIDKHRRHDG